MGEKAAQLPAVATSRRWPAELPWRTGPGDPTNNDPVRRSLLFSSKSLAPVGDSVQGQGLAEQQGFA